MKLNLDLPVKTVYGNSLKRPSVKFSELQAKYSQIHGPNWFEKIPEVEQKEIQSELERDMTLGYLLVEALPDSLPKEASQNEQLAVGKLQRRVVKGGEQVFTADEVAKLKKGAAEFLCKRSMQAVATIVLEMLDPAEAHVEPSQVEESAR